MPSQDTMTAPAPAIHQSQQLRTIRKTRFPTSRGDFRLYVTEENPQSNLDLHTHAFEELVLITGGTGTHVTESVSYPIQAGDVFVIHTDFGHGYTDTEGLSLINFLYEPDALLLPFRELRKLPGYHALFCLEPQYRAQHSFQSRLRLPPDELGRAMEITDLLRQELNHRDAGFEFIATAHFMQLIGYLSRRYAGMAGRACAPLIHLGEVISHLETHFAEPVRVEELCRLSHMSRSALFRAFQRSTGLAPLEYLLRLRMQRAGELLRRTTLSVKEIALETGFTDSNYFTRQYRQHTGESPRATRSRHQPHPRRA